MNVRMAPTTRVVATSAETVVRGLGVALLIGVAQIHFLDVFDKFHENKPQFWMFVALIAGCVVAAATLIRWSGTMVWLLAGLCGLAPLVMYIISRTVGLTGVSDDVGNWTEPLGLMSLSTEAMLVALTGYALISGIGRSSAR